jgi:opacity protein-like surface antigen
MLRSYIHCFNLVSKPIEKPENLISMRSFVPAGRLTVVLVFFSLFATQSFSQSVTSGNGKWELGLGLGPVFFLGDVGGNRGAGRTFLKDLNFPLTKFMKGAYVAYFPTDWLGFRLAINQGMLEGDDSIINDHGGKEHDRKQRNLKFKSNLEEAYLAMEVYPTILLGADQGIFERLIPYGVAGVGIFHFNPKGPYYGPNGTQWVALRPLRLEGQGMAEYPDRKMYSLTQMNIPMGFGVKYFIKDNMYIGVEILHRKTFTDYIDDVSKTYIDPKLFDKYLTPAQAVMAKQLEYRERFLNPTIARPYINKQRGDPSQNDAYFSTIVKLGWRLESKNSPHNRALRQIRCPIYY